MKLGIQHPSLTILPDYTDEKEKLPKREGGHKLWHFSSFPFLRLLPTVVAQNHILSRSSQYTVLAHFILGFPREASICQHWLTRWLRSSDTEWETPAPTRKLTLPTREKRGPGVGAAEVTSHVLRGRSRLPGAQPPRGCTFYSHHPSRPFWRRSFERRKLGHTI